MSINSFIPLENQIDHHKKPIEFQIKSNSINRIIEIQTKQDQTIYSSKINYCPTLTCSSYSPKSIRLNKSSINSNKFIQNIRVSVQSAINQRNSSRPLRDLINEIKSNSNLSMKTLSSIQPIIDHKNKEESVVKFDIVNRDGIQRSQTFSSTNDVSSNEIKINHCSLSFSRNSLNNLNEIPSIDNKSQTKREAIVKQMYDTEISYVEALKNLVTKYYLPSKDKDIVCNDLINDIFYKIPEIHIHHTAFLICLSEKLTQWNCQQTIGDILFQMFSRISVVETYTSFVTNYNRCQIALNLCRESSSFNKFIEQQIRDHRGKLSLNDLLIQPVQRIPRYELYLKDFLKSTNLTHPDYQLLLKAQSQIHLLVQQIDQVQKQVSTNDSNYCLQILKELIEHSNDLVNPNRYLIRIDNLQIQISSSLKKDRYLFLFNDLILITNSKKKSNNLNKKNSNLIILNSLCGKQYIENEKYKLIMKISLDKIQLNKSRSSIGTNPIFKKSLSIQKNLQEDFLILGQISNLSKTITIPHQQLDDAIKETFEIVNKELNSEKRSNSERNSIRLIFNSTDQIQKIELFFSSFENKLNWQTSFIQAKKTQLENYNEQKLIMFEQVVKVDHHRSGNELTCGIIRLNLNDLCLCSNQGDICLINLNSNFNIQLFNSIGREQINTIEYIRSFKINNDERKQKNDFNYSFLSDSSEDEFEDFNNENDSIWIGTQSGKLFIYKCLQTNNSFQRTNRFVKQFHCSIHSILFVEIENKVYLGLDNRQLCLFKRDSNGQWDFDNPFIQTIQQNIDQTDENTKTNSIRLICAIENKLWCAIEDKIFIICPKSIQVQNSFVVDEYHRHICSIVKDTYSLDYVWIATENSHQIYLFHSTHYNCLLELNIRQAIIEKLQMCDELIRSHKLGCLHIRTMYVYKNILWIGTSAGIIVYLKLSQISTKFNRNLIEFECLSQGHSGPVCLFVSKSIDHLNSSILISIGYGFEQFHLENQQILDKDDSFIHLIFWNLNL